MKLMSLLKATLSEDMNMFKYQTSKNSSKIKKIIFPLFLFVVVCFSVGVYAYMIASSLVPLKLTYIMLSLFILLVTVTTFMQGIYKSQGILFDAKDNDLLFSLPIAKEKILFAKIFKLLLFQYIYNLMFLLPAFIIYIYFERPNINFYIVSIIMTFMVPLIPTVISSVIGYLIKMFSSKSNSKRIIQTILSSIVFLAIFFLSSNLENFIKDIAKNANDINDFLIKVYYPIGLYVKLINKFDFISLFKLIIFNVLPLVLFVMIGSKYYFKIIFNSKENISRSKHKETYKKHSKIYSLVLKELRRYFSSPIYMFNTSFGLLLLLVFTIMLCFKGSDSLNGIFTNYDLNLDAGIWSVFYILILFSTSMTSITSSSVSLEYKTFNITKSLPVSEIDVLKGKLIYPFIIEMPFLLISEMLFFIFFKPNLFYMLIVLLISIFMVLFSSLIGLIINLKYPKLNANNDTEVVKQSMSSMIAVFMGMGTFVVSLLVIGYLSKFFEFSFIICAHFLLVLLVDAVLYYILIKYGVNDYKEISI